MKKVFVLIIAIALTCACAYAGDDLNPNFVKEYPSKKGNVTFDHQLHAESLQECAGCHSQLDMFGGEVNKKYAHTVCKTCHKNMTQDAPNSPVTCTGCHVR